MKLIDADALLEKIKALQEQKENTAQSFDNNCGERCAELWCVEDLIENAEEISCRTCGNRDCPLFCFTHDCRCGKWEAKEDEETTGDND